MKQVLLVLIAIVLPLQSAPAAPLSVLRISPSGEDVEPTRQIVVQFDRDVTQLGPSMKKVENVGVVIEPVLPCHWRYLDAATLSCDLAERDQTKLSTQYRVTVKKGYAAKDGSILAEDVNGEFLTQRPVVQNSWFRRWLAPTRASFVLVLNQRVDVASLAAHLVFRSASARDVGAEVKKMKSGHDQLYRISPKDDLPIGEEVTLLVLPGVQSEQGPEMGIEDREVLRFSTIPKFSFLGVRCTDFEGENMLLRAGEAGTSLCDPLQTVALAFSSPVLSEDVARVFRFDPPLSQKDENPWESNSSYSQLTSPYQVGGSFDVSIPVFLRAHQRYELRPSGEKLLDEFGRELSNDVHFSFETGHRAPFFTLGSSFSVLEKNASTELPVFINNIDTLEARYRVLSADTLSEPQTQTIDPPAVADISFAYPFPVRDFLHGRSGIVEGKLKSSPAAGSRSDLSSKAPRWFSAEVTPFHVHVKLGHFNSLVWVTNFSDGAPLADASVWITSNVFGKLEPFIVPGTAVRTDRRGIAKLPGLTTLDPTLETIESWSSLGATDSAHFDVRVKKGDDIASVPIVYELNVWPSADDDYIPTELKAEHGHLHTWGFSPQGIYRAGDKIPFVLFVREDENNSTKLAPRGTYTVTVFDPREKAIWKKKGITLDDFGSYHDVFPTAPSAAVGWYRVEVSGDFFAGGKESFRVLLSDFRPAPFHVLLDVQEKQGVAGSSLHLRSQATFHAGGPYAGGLTRLSARVQPSFDTPESKELKGFEFHALLPGADAARAEREGLVHQSEAKADSDGQRELTIELPETLPIARGIVSLEAAVKDERGKNISQTTTIPFVGRDRFVGVKLRSWVLRAGEEAVAESVVVDPTWKLVPGSDVEMKVQRMERKASRVKGPGNSYLTKFIESWIDEADCHGKTSDTAVTCHFVPQKAGEYRVRASVQDTRGRVHESEVSSWATGKTELVWEEEPSTALKVVPEKKEYHVGDRVRLFIENPFRQGRALVTIERYGVLKSWVETFSSQTPIVEFPIEARFAPGFYVSIVAMSGRVADAPLEGSVDLGKPAFRMGYAKLSVRDPSAELMVTLTPDSAQHRPGDQVKVNIHVANRLGSTPESELAVLAIDEAVFDLLPEKEKYFDPAQGLRNLDPLDLRNYNLLRYLVGRRKFEKKGANPGGGGGHDIDFRVVKNYVAFFNPALSVDGKGNAHFEFTAPANLTKWKLLAVATTKGKELGLGQGAVAVSRPTEIRPAVPNFLRVGDHVEARFTVLNREAATRMLRGSIEVNTGGGKTNKEIALEAKSFEPAVFSVPLDATVPGAIKLTVRLGDSIDTDAVQVEVPVQSAATETTVGQYRFQMHGDAQETIEVPANIDPAQSSLSVTALGSPKSDTASAFQYMQHYGYSCLEQLTSRSVAAHLVSNYADVLPSSYDWQDRDKFIRDAVARIGTFQAPSGGLAFFMPTEDAVSPYLSGYVAVVLSWLRDGGFEPAAGVREKLDSYLLELLAKNPQRKEFSREALSSIRALAATGLALANKLPASELVRLNEVRADMGVFGKSMLLAASSSFDTPPIDENELVRALLSSASESAGHLTLTHPGETDWETLGSADRDNCAALWSLSLRRERRGEDSSLEDLAHKLAWSIAALRLPSGSWSNTHENAYCLEALSEYAKAFSVQSMLPTLTLGIGSSAAEVGEQNVSFTRNLAAQEVAKTLNIDVHPATAEPYSYSLRLTAAETTPATEPVLAGFELHRTYSMKDGDKWKKLAEPISLKEGDVVKIELDVSVPADRAFVVVDDPLPAGFEPVNGDLATTSDEDAQDKDNEDLYELYDDGFYFRELRNEGARFYADRLSQGNYHLKYTAQVIAPGGFLVPPAKAEEMYSPDVRGLTPATRLSVH